MYHDEPLFLLLQISFQKLVLLSCIQSWMCIASILLIAWLFRYLTGIIMLPIVFSIISFAGSGNAHIGFNHDGLCFIATLVLW